MLVTVNGIKVDLDETKHYALQLLDENTLAVYEFKNVDDVTNEDSEPNLAYTIKR